MQSSVAARSPHAPSVVQEVHPAAAATLPAVSGNSFARRDLQEVSP